SILVKNIKIKPFITVYPTDEVDAVAKKLVDNNVNHLPVVDKNGKLRGIVTSWDIANAVAKGKKKLSDVMTRKVIIAREDEPVDVVARRIDKYEISGLPIIDKENNVKGMITTEDISRLIYDTKKGKNGGFL
ncbi:MAG: CBS domain-containing protein, partial [Methanobacterium paludis]|nr:CBS domain-containing protein [Methanobacterium paludis]